MAVESEFESLDAMRAALIERELKKRPTRLAPSLSRYMTKKLTVTLPVDDLQLWLDLASARERHAFVEAYRGYEPATEQERREIEITLHELCADTGYKATIYKGNVSGLYIWQIKRHKYSGSAKRREKLRRDLASGNLTADAVAYGARAE
jgi:hypothetical protein